DPAYDQITLLGLAFEAGFNSKATFNRFFKQLTGESPVKYKAGLENEVSSPDLRRHRQRRAILLIRKPTNSNPFATPPWSKEKLNRPFMFRNYLKIASRNLLKNKVYSLINVSGLAVGMASAILIFLWIQNEVSHDRFHSRIDRIYELNNRNKFQG